jgi:hypothetical protein
VAAYEVLLLNTAIPQIQAAQTGDTYVVPRDIAFSAALTLSAGTANGVPYLNASKVLTTGSALTFDGTNLGVSAVTGTIVVTSTTGTNAVYQSFTNTGGTYYSGIDNSTGATFTGTAYSVFRYAPVGRVIQDVIAGTGVITEISLSGLEVKQSQLIGYSSYAGIGTNGLAVAGNVGIGTASPTVRLQTSSARSATLSSAIFGTSGTGVVNDFNKLTLHVQNTLGGSTGGAGIGAVLEAAASNRTGLALYYDSGSGSQTEGVRLDSSGNLGLGVTPSAWNAGHTAMQIAFSGAIHGSDSGNNLLVNSNAYFDSVGAFRYIQTGFASSYEQNSGQHRWSTASSGTAGNVISFTQVLTLDGIDGSGYGKNLKLGGTADRATTKGTHHFDIFDGTAPVGTLANGISFYSAAGEAYVMDAAGNATLISPHDFETNEWIFRSKHTPSGKVLRIDVERLLRFVNTHFGLDAVKEFVEE